MIHVYHAVCSVERTLICHSAMEAVGAHTRWLFITSGLLSVYLKGAPSFIQQHAPCNAISEYTC